MAKQNVAEQETLGEAMNKTELFFEQNGRTIGYVFLGLLVLAALVFGYRALIVQPRAEKAAEMISEAQVRFEGENPDFELALLGDAQILIEKGVRPDQVLALVTAVRRREKLLQPGSFWWDFFEKVWVRVIPLRPGIDRKSTRLNSSHL